jgi:hypothetical protein
MKNQPKVTRTSILNAIEAVLSNPDVRKATVYQHPNLTVKLTRQFKYDGRHSRATFLLTIGSPNYAESEFIKICKKAGEPFPVRRVQLKFYPVKK